MTDVQTRRNRAVKQALAQLRRSDKDAARETAVHIIASCATEEAADRQQAIEEFIRNLDAERAGLDVPMTAHCLCGHTAGDHKDERNEWTICFHPSCGCLGFQQER